MISSDFLLKIKFLIILNLFITKKIIVLYSIVIIILMSDDDDDYYHKYTNALKDYKRLDIHRKLKTLNLL
jgi:hypothetical protein